MCVCITWHNLKDTQAERPYLQEVGDPSQGMGWGSEGRVFGLYPAIWPISIGVRWQVKLRSPDRQTSLWVGTDRNRIGGKGMFCKGQMVSVGPQRIFLNSLNISIGIQCSPHYHLMAHCTLQPRETHTNRTTLFVSSVVSLMPWTHIQQETPSLS